MLIGISDPATAQVARWRDYIEEASARFGVPVDWIERVMQSESGGRTHVGGRPIISRAGALGLMQLMPGTWADLRTRYRLGDDPFDPRANILGGTAYLRMMHDQFGYPGLFAAYNAGPLRYARHLATGSALPLETRAYVAKVGQRPVYAVMSGWKLGTDPTIGFSVAEPTKDRAVDTLFAIRR